VWVGVCFLFVGVVAAASSNKNKTRVKETVQKLASHVLKNDPV